MGHISRLVDLLGSVSDADVERVAGRLRSMRDRSGTLYVAGDGGAAALAGHIATDLSKATRAGAGPRVWSLAENPALMTMIANDHGFDEVFAYQLANVLRPEDTLLVISGSGRSRNLVRAAEVARERDVEILALLGFGGGSLAAFAAEAIVVPSTDYGLIEDVHHAIAHAIADALTAAGPAIPRAAILDRDGVLGESPAIGEYVPDASAFRWLPGAIEAVRTLNAAGVKIAVATNQRGIALGRISAQDVAAIHDRMRADLGAAGAHIEGFYVCPHALEDDCACRKPRVGLIERAASDLRVAPHECVVFGDSEVDLAMARRAGARPVVIGDLEVGGVERWPDLLSAVRAVLEGRPRAIATR